MLQLVLLVDAERVRGRTSRQEPEFPVRDVLDGRSSGRWGLLSQQGEGRSDEEAESQDGAEHADIIWRAERRGYW